MPVDPLSPIWSRSLTIHKDQWSSGDLTGRFPVRPFHGFEYILVVAHKGYINLTPLRSRTSASYVSAYTSIVLFFKTLSHPLTHLLLDNETSSDLTTFFLSSLITYQYVPPNNHRTLPAERAIGTAKNHILSVLAACHVSFPSNGWTDLLPHIELTLNTVRPWKPNPLLSAWHGIHSTPFDFASHPIHPPPVNLLLPMTRRYSGVVGKTRDSGFLPLPCFTSLPLPQRFPPPLQLQPCVPDFRPFP